LPVDRVTLRTGDEVENGAKGILRGKGIPTILNHEFEYRLSIRSLYFSYATSCSICNYFGTKFKVDRRFASLGSREKLCLTSFDELEIPYATAVSPRQRVTTLHSFTANKPLFILKRFLIPFDVQYNGDHNRFRDRIGQQ